MGWITVLGTSVDYPIVQAPADVSTWHLSHNVYGNWNIYGCPYLDVDSEEEGFDFQAAYVFARIMDDGFMLAPPVSLDSVECREIMLQTPEKKVWLEIYTVDIATLGLSENRLAFRVKQLFRNGFATLLVTPIPLLLFQRKRTASKPS